MLDQILISAFSLSSITLSYWPHRDWRKWGCLFGMAAQPCWVWMVVHKGLWGILPLTPLYSALYLWAIYNHWLASSAKAPTEGDMRGAGTLSPSS
jgi:hypothetical protein